MSEPTSFSHGGTSSERAIDRATSMLCWRVMAENSTVRMCASEIINQLLSGRGIVAERGSKRLNTTPRFQRYIDHSFRPFLIDAYRHIMCIGVVPVAYRRNALGEMYPFVPRPGTYSITTYAREGEQYFKFYWDTSELDANNPGSLPATYVYKTGTYKHKMLITNERLSGHAGTGTLFGRYDAKVSVVSGFGFDPMLTGQLSSIMSTIIPHVMLTNELTDQAVTAERIACCPPIVTEYNPALEKGNRQMHERQYFAGEGAADSGVDPGDKRAQASFERNAEQMEVFRRHVENYVQTYGEESARNAFGPYVDTLSSGQAALESPAPIWARNAIGYTMPWLNQFYLGTERKVTNVQLPRARGDYVNLTKQVDENICAAMGVPRSLFVAASNVRSGVESVNDTLQRTVRFWHAQLGNLGTMVYYQIFGEEDLKAELEARIRKKRSGVLLRDGMRVPSLKEMLTDDDLFAVEKETEIRITFDLHPCSSPQDLVTAWSFGMLDDKTFGQTFLRCIGMSEDDLASKKLLFSKEERKMLVAGGPTKLDEKRKDSAAGDRFGESSGGGSKRVQ